MSFPSHRVDTSPVLLDREVVEVAFPLRIEQFSAPDPRQMVSDTNFGGSTPSPLRLAELSSSIPARSAFWPAFQLLARFPGVRSKSPTTTRLFVTVPDLAWHFILEAKHGYRNC